MRKRLCGAPWWNSVGNLTAHMMYQTPQQCPACDLEGVLEGNEEIDRERERTVFAGETIYDGAEYDYDYPTFTLTIAADYFMALASLIAPAVVLASDRDLQDIGLAYERWWEIPEAVRDIVVLQGGTELAAQVVLARGTEWSWRSGASYVHCST